MMDEFKKEKISFLIETVILTSSFVCLFKKSYISSMITYDALYILIHIYMQMSPSQN
jgi:hypothetical protein